MTKEGFDSQTLSGQYLAREEFGLLYICQGWD